MKIYLCKRFNLTKTIRHILVRTVFFSITENNICYYKQPWCVLHKYIRYAIEM